jgi:hypothetical protein
VYTAVPFLLGRCKVRRGLSWNEDRIVSGNGERMRDEVDIDT